MDQKLKIVGKRQPKVDAWERVSGKAKFASDIYLPGMLFAKILRSPYPHAKVLNIDIGKAKSLPGVKVILTPKDMPPFRWHPDMPILTDIARFEGDDIAVVAAVDEERTREAIDLIKVDYEVLPFVLDPEEAMKPGAPKIHPQGNIIGGKPLLLQRGDIEKVIVSELGGGVALDGECQIGGIHAAAIVGNADQREPTGCRHHLDVGGAGIERILDQLFHH